MTDKRPWILCIVLAWLLLGALAGQQPANQSNAQPRMTLDQRLEEIEARLDALEARLAEMRPAAGLGASAEAKLDRLEARLIRLETARAPRDIGGSFTRLLESRVRSLERQVARLRQ